MSLERLDEQSKENIAHLMDRIRKRECCVFVGAGLSRAAWYPSWSELLDTLKAESEDLLGTSINDAHLDYYDRAEKYREILGLDNYRNIIQKEFNPENNKQPWLPVHLDLVEMPFVSYITTNYDCVIENAYRKMGLEPTYSFYPLFPMTHLRDRQIYHIHGIIDHSRLLETQDSIVLTRSDFDEAYNQDSNLIKLITCLYTELTLFFVGFNVRDPSMMRILRSSLLEFEKTRSVASARGSGPLKNLKHFALLPYPNKTPTDVDIGRRIMTEEIDLDAKNREDEELRSLGVYTIRYTGDTQNHTQLINVIHDLNIIITGIKEPLISQDLTFRGV
jgi:hypothetical protein